MAKKIPIKVPDSSLTLEQNLDVLSHWAATYNINTDAREPLDVEIDFSDSFFQVLEPLSEEIQAFGKTYQGNVGKAVDEFQKLVARNFRGSTLDSDTTRRLTGIAARLAIDTLARYNYQPQSVHEGVAYLLNGHFWDDLCSDARAIPGFNSHYNGWRSHVLNAIHLVGNDATLKFDSGICDGAYYCSNPEGKRDYTVHFDRLGMLSLSTQGASVLGNHEIFHAILTLDAVKYIQKWEPDWSMGAIYRRINCYEDVRVTAAGVNVTNDRKLRAGHLYQAHTAFLVAHMKGTDPQDPNLHANECFYLTIKEGLGAAVPYKCDPKAEAWLASNREHILALADRRTIPVGDHGRLNFITRDARRQECALAAAEHLHALVTSEIQEQNQNKGGQGKEQGKEQGQSSDKSSGQDQDGKSQPQPSQGKEAGDQSSSNQKDKSGKDAKQPGEKSDQQSQGADRKDGEKDSMNSADGNGQKSDQAQPSEGKKSEGSDTQEGEAAKDSSKQGDKSGQQGQGKDPSSEGQNQQGEGKKDASQANAGPEEGKQAGEQGDKGESGEEQGSENGGSQGSSKESGKEGAGAQAEGQGKESGQPAQTDGAQGQQGKSGGRETGGSGGQADAQPGDPGNSAAGSPSQDGTSGNAQGSGNSQGASQPGAGTGGGKPEASKPQAEANGVGPKKNASPSSSGNGKPGDPDKPRRSWGEAPKEEESHEPTAVGKAAEGQRKYHDQQQSAAADLPPPPPADHPVPEVAHEMLVFERAYINAPLETLEREHGATIREMTRLYQESMRNAKAQVPKPEPRIQGDRLNMPAYIRQTHIDKDYEKIYERKPRDIMESEYTFHLVMDSSGSMYCGSPPTIQPATVLMSIQMLALLGAGHRSSLSAFAQNGEGMIPAVKSVAEAAPFLKTVLSRAMDGRQIHQGAGMGSGTEIYYSLRAPMEIIRQTKEIAGPQAIMVFSDGGVSNQHSSATEGLLRHCRQAKIPLIYACYPHVPPSISDIVGEQACVALPDLSLASCKKVHRVLLDTMKRNKLLVDVAEGKRVIQEIKRLKYSPDLKAGEIPVWKGAGR